MGSILDNVASYIVKRPGIGNELGEEGTATLVWRLLHVSQFFRGFNRQLTTRSPQHGVICNQVVLLKDGVPKHGKSGSSREIPLDKPLAVA